MYFEQMIAENDTLEFSQKITFFENFEEFFAKNVFFPKNVILL